MAFKVIQTLSKFPDAVEVREEEDGKKNLTFLFMRRNSRPLDYEQLEIAHRLQEFGHLVYVRVAGVDISLEQFERQGVYSVRTSATVQSLQGRRNRMSELRQLEAELEVFDKEDPAYFLKAQRVQHLRSMLETAEPTPDLRSLKRSDRDLTHVVESLSQQKANDFINENPAASLIGEMIMSYADRAEKFGVTKATKGWDAIISHWTKANQAEMELQKKGGDEK